VDRDLSAFLVQLSTALHKSAAYPPGHPMVTGAVDLAHRSLTQLLAQRSSLSVGVTRTQLLIEGESTDPSHLVLRELAQRLYRRQLGGITFSSGVEPAEFVDLLRALGAEASPGGGESAEATQWPHVRLHPMAFDQLRLVGDADQGGSRAPADSNQLWNDLASSALGLTSNGGDEVADASMVAQAIDARVRDPEYAGALTRQLLGMARHAQSSEAAEAKAVGKQLVDLVRSLKPETLRQLLAFGPDRGDREQLARAMSRTMPVTAVIDLVRASSEASEQTISHSLLRILAKLASHAEAESGGTKPDDGLQDMVRELVADWALKDPNPDAYRAMLEGFARPGGLPAASGGAKAGDLMEPLRVVQLSIELNVVSESLTTAVDSLVERKETPALLNLLTQAPTGDAAAEAVWSRLPTRDELRRALEREEPDMALVERLLRRLGIEAAEPLLDALGGADSRNTRRRLLAWLAQLGPGVGPLIMARLESPHWYVLRNMLVLLGGLDHWPEGFSPSAYLAHADARVRREALKLALRVPELRDQAIRTGLADGDDLIVRTALAAALDGCSAEAAPRLIELTESRGQAADVRLQVVKVLASLQTPAARDCLIRRVLTRRGWIPWRRLASKSPELVVAVSGLAARWADDSKAAAVLRVAARSSDPEIRSAAGVAS
jgi:hypothetical protein